MNENQIASKWWLQLPLAKVIEYAKKHKTIEDHSEEDVLEIWKTRTQYNEKLYFLVGDNEAVKQFRLNREKFLKNLFGHQFNIIEMDASIERPDLILSKNYPKSSYTALSAQEYNKLKQFK